MQHIHGLAHSAARHDTHMRSVSATLERISHFSDPPTPEFMLVGAAGNAFATTTEIQVMKPHEDLLSDDKEDWEEAIEDEYQRFQRLNLFQARTRATISRHAKILTSTWAMKKKSNGKYRARQNMRGYGQIPHVHYRPAWISAPVTNAVTIRSMLVLLLMMEGYAHIIDICSAFLLGVFDSGEDLYAYIPKGWENKYSGDVILKLMKTVYWLKQAANCFYRLLVSVMRSLSFQKSLADPCLYHKWDENHGLMVWTSLYDDLLAIEANKGAVLKEVEDMKKK